MPVEKDWDLLIHQYLEGSLEETDAVRLNEAVKTDSRVLHRLAEMAFDDALLHEVLSEPGEIEPPVARPWANLVAAAVVVITVAGSILYWSLRPPSPPAINQVHAAPLPEPKPEPSPVKTEFEVRGTVASRDDD